MIFDLKKSKIYKAVLFYRLFPAGILKFYRVLFFVLGLMPVIFTVVNRAYDTDITVSIGWTLVVLPFAFSVWFFELFGNYYLKYPKIRSTNNLADLMEYEAARMFDRAFELSRSFSEKKLSVKTLLSAIIEDSVTEKLFIRIMPGFSSIRKQLKESLNTPKSFSGMFSLFSSQEVSPEIIKLLEGALILRDKHGSQRISVLDIMAEIFDHSDEFKQFIISQDLDKDDLEELAEWYEHIWSFWREYRKFWSLENLLHQPPIGKDWIFGYARHLNAFASNITDKVEFARPVVRLTTRTKEIEQIEQILARSGENNVLLVGEEGVGKDKIILDFSEMIARGRALPQLNYKKVFNLNLSLVVGASKSIADVQNILLNILNEASRAGNLILVLDDFHNFIGEMGGLGRIDVSEIIVPYLKSSNIQIIAITNPASFHKFIEGRSELMQVFERVNITEPDLAQTRQMVEEGVPVIESRSGVLITYGAIKEIVSGSDKFIRATPFPEKAFDLLAEVVSYAVAQKERIITKQHVDEVINRKTGIPLGPIAGEEKEKLTHLEELMHKELIGQDRAVQVVASTMRRLRTGLSKRGKPAGVFLFVGPTGVGKTLTAKILAKTYFGSADRMLRFDMSEYQTLESLDRFLGSTKTNEPGQFATATRDNPFSLILLDEMEKADRNILNIFLQVFDEGRLTDVFGRKINFEQNIIIATSNAGADFIRNLVKEGLDPSLEKEKVVDVLIQGGSFRPELLNRFDEIVIFHPLSQDQVSKITGLLLGSLAGRLKEQGYDFKPTPEVVDYVAKAGFDPQFGARPIERVIRDKVEGAIAKKILNGDVKKGTAFSLTLSDFG
ncbi:MAG: ATP-dependent Clp protease ATP-binding subunit [bacterium]|nr:ATP-dependent Clp protease ATP-binding subunit [bacterium]